MNITINAHSSIRIETQGKVIYFDPFKIEKSAFDADVIFLTHSHYDHFSPEDIDKIKSDETVFVCPKTMEKDVKRYGIDKTKILSFSPCESGSAAGFSFYTVPAYNENKQFHPKEKQWLGYIVTVEDRKIYVAGDTDALKENESINCDVALIPVGGTYTMTAEEAAEFVNDMRPKTAIPTHYGSIVGKKGDGDKFKSLVEKDISVEILIQNS